jgi:flagellar biosynthesis protein FlhA
LTASVRMSLRRLIVQTIVGADAELPVVTLDPGLEQLLLKSVQQHHNDSATEEIGLILEPGMMERLQRSLSDTAQRQEMMGKPAVLLVSHVLRAPLSKFVRLAVDRMHVLSYQEVPDNKKITIVAAVSA